MSTTQIEELAAPSAPLRKKGPEYLAALKIHGWESEIPSVNNLLLYLARKSRSESSLRVYASHLHKFTKYTGRSAQELVKMRRDIAEKSIQAYADSLSKGSPRYSNNAIYALSAFYYSNGYRHARALDLEFFHVPRRLRIAPEYIPTRIEIYRMADCAGTLRNRAIILSLYSSGLRNSALRALLVRDVIDELRRDVSYVLLPVYVEMNARVPGGCKGNIPYFSFACEEASNSIRLYVREREEKYGKLSGDEPLFSSDYNQIPSQNRNSKILSSRELELIVKSDAKKAMIADWNGVHPHVLRKAYETVLHSQLIDGSNMDVKVQEILMGHTLPGSQDPYFDRKVEWLRIQYSKLRFSRPNVEDKFRLLRNAVARAFEGLDLDPEQVIEEYVRTKQNAASNPMV